MEYKRQVKKQTNYIDLNQFVKRGKTINWKASIGITANFMYNNKQHTIKILEVLQNPYLRVLIDDTYEEICVNSKVKNAQFGNLFYEPLYKYQIGQVINNLEILEQNIKYKMKSYKCKCIYDNYIFDITEYDLCNGHHRCPICSNSIVIKGINDIATTHPWMVEYFDNIDDAYTHTYGSSKKILFKCPKCSHIREKTISEVSADGYYSCPMCSDNISYPNKFAHELFSQLESQYKYYKYEYSPTWAKLYRYDNYIELLDGRKIIVEMDGGYHYLNNENIKKCDAEKDQLANQHNIIMVRINCNYIKIECRYKTIKNNTTKALSEYFDLTNINWNKCNLVGCTNQLLQVVEFYKNNSYWSYEDIANKFKIHVSTVKTFLKRAEEMGIFKYDRIDYIQNRKLSGKEVAMYDLDGKLIGVYKTLRHIKDAFSDKNFYPNSINAAIRLRNGLFKGYQFKYITHDEFLKHLPVIE